MFRKIELFAKLPRIQKNLEDIFRQVVSKKKIHFDSPGLKLRAIIENFRVIVAFSLRTCLVPFRKLWLTKNYEKNLAYVRKASI